MKTSQQERDFLAVKKFLEDNPGTTTRKAIDNIAKAHGKSTSTVQVGYYKTLRAKNGAAAPKKRVARKANTAKPKNSLDLNVIRASLKDALSTIDMLEKQNKKNEEIVTGLRKALSV